MAHVPQSPAFRDWLAEAIGQAKISKRELARRMAARHPRGATADTVETARRTINKILAGDMTPTQPTRDSIAAALGRDDHPSVSADEDDEVPDLDATLAAMAREAAELARMMRRLERRRKAAA
jgi:transcriptional regulator with XRE-family HTH domain